MNAIFHFFKAIDNFLNICVEYLDYRIMTGKFVGDISYQLDHFGHFSYKKIRKAYFITIRSNLYQILFTILSALWVLLMKIPLFEMIASITGDAIKIIITCYSEIFIVFALTFPSSILLLNWFQTSISVFLVALIPILLLDIFFVSALYYCIDQREDGKKISLWKSLRVILRHFTSVSFPIITESAIILEVLVAFSLIALFVSYVFDTFKLSWSDSIVYWFVILFTGSLIGIGIFLLNLMMHQTYFSILLDQIPFQEATKRAGRHLKEYFPPITFFYVLLYLFCAIFTWRALLSYLYLGLTVGIFCTIALGTFLGFLLRRKFPVKSVTQITQNDIHKTHPVFVIIILFGLINYILVAILLMKEYQPLLAFIQQQQDNFLASQEVKQFSNTTYGYSLDYPQNWSVYQWNTNSVTFYNNYTGTVTGGTWMTINVSSYDTSIFQKLYDSAPGIVTYNTQSKEVTTKVSNQSIQGYNALNYTYIKSGLPYTQYETHYLIHKNNNVYDIAFVSITNDVANYNSDLFQKIISSFRFTQ